ncbi:MAG TPA: hypothetical protein VK730_04440 [Solirubrobacteraceae bacterium]|nr:hypothetical protein [Solirubrobacteraceae bacterium]
MRHQPMRFVAISVAVSLTLGLAAAITLVSAAGASTIPVTPPSLIQTALVTTSVPAPSNDERANAQVVRSLPATINGTTVGATLEAGEPESSCNVATTNSVWYSVRAQSAERIALDLTAGGELDGTVAVYHAVRSQLQSVQCQQTEAHGKAALSFKASKNGLYLIRVAALQNSQLANFTLEVFLPTPAVGPPGAALPSSGVSGQVDRIQNINAAYAFTMHSGVSYLINLANRTKGACVSGALFAPSTSSFEGEPALLRVGCGGYRLFTPGPGQGGLYSFEVTPRPSYRGVQRFHLQVATAGPAETAPGIALGNYAQAHARLDGRAVSVLRLYRLDVTSHSNLTLELTAPASADFNLQLRSQDGAVIECRCGGSGSQKLQRQLQPGRYYAVVSVRDATAGNFTLVRQSRTITSTSLSFSSNRAAPGQGVGIDVKVAPAASGPVTVEIERLDPVFGWQFYRQVSALVSEGAASIAFVPPAIGEWRAKATYEGSRTSSPSAVGFSYLQVS